MISFSRFQKIRSVRAALALAVSIPFLASSVSKAVPVESGDIKAYCLAVWNGQDASKTVPEALEQGIGLYGFTAPRTVGGLVPYEKFFHKQVKELSGDEKNIAVLARAYHGKSSSAEWKGGEFVEAEKMESRPEALE